MKRGASELSLLVGVNKPVGMTSHDVVNACRRIFGERRVGHTGTLDPMASGVLPVCIGPATRLDAYLVGHDKEYVAQVLFGVSTNTDDIEGQVEERGEVFSDMYDDQIAESMVAGLVGTHDQVPPAYSAIKVDGKPAYKLARAGKDVQLASRRCEVRSAEFLGMADVEFDGAPRLAWMMRLEVSKGTYIRSLARDLGRKLGVPSCLSALERTRAGRISLADCTTISALEQGLPAAIDPVRALGFRFAFGDDVAKQVVHGAYLPAQSLRLHEPLDMAGDVSQCMCVSQVRPSDAPARDGELVCVVVENTLNAIYAFDAPHDSWKSACVFAQGVCRE